MLESAFASGSAFALGCVISLGFAMRRSVFVLRPFSQVLRGVTDGAREGRLIVIRLILCSGL